MTFVQHPVELRKCPSPVSITSSLARGEIRVRDHREHAVQGFGLGRVNADDSGVRMRAPQNAAGKHAGAS